MKALLCLIITLFELLQFGKCCYMINQMKLTSSKAFKENPSTYDNITTYIHTEDIGLGVNQLCSNIINSPSNLNDQSGLIDGYNIALDAFPCFKKMQINITTDILSSWAQMISITIDCQTTNMKKGGAANIQYSLSQMQFYSDTPIISLTLKQIVGRKQQGTLVNLLPNTTMLNTTYTVSFIVDWSTCNNIADRNYSKIQQSSDFYFNYNALLEQYPLYKEPVSNLSTSTNSTFQNVTKISNSTVTQEPQESIYKKLPLIIGLSAGIGIGGLFIFIGICMCIRERKRQAEEIANQNKKPVGVEGLVQNDQNLTQQRLKNGKKQEEKELVPQRDNLDDSETTINQNANELARSYKDQHKFEKTKTITSLDEKDGIQIIQLSQENSKLKSRRRRIVEQDISGQIDEEMRDVVYPIDSPKIGDYLSNSTARSNPGQNVKFTLKMQPMMPESISPSKKIVKLPEIDFDVSKKALPKSAFINNTMLSLAMGMIKNVETIKNPSKKKKKYSARRKMQQPDAQPKQAAKDRSEQYKDPAVEADIEAIIKGIEEEHVKRNLE